VHTDQRRATAARRTAPAGRPGLQDHPGERHGGALRRCDCPAVQIARPPQRPLRGVLLALAEFLGCLPARSPRSDRRGPLRCSRHAVQRVTRRASPLHGCVKRILTRDFGVLAAAAKWRPLVVLTPRPSQATDDAAAACTPSPYAATSPSASGSRYRPWAELLERTFAVDVETCPRCGGHMRRVAVIAARVSSRGGLRGGDEAAQRAHQALGGAATAISGPPHQITYAPLSEIASSRRLQQWRAFERVL
jgi:hypothetical protein